MAADFTPDFSASMAAGFIPGFMNFMPAASTTAILANSTASASCTDLITTASAVDLLSSPPSAAGGAADGAGPITITQSGGAANGAGPTTITRTVATTVRTLRRLLVLLRRSAGLLPLRGTVQHRLADGSGELRGAARRRAAVAS